MGERPPFRLPREPSVVTETIAREQLLSVTEAAEFLRYCDATVRRAVARGELRGLKVGNRWRFAVADLHAYLARSDDYTELHEAAVKAAPRLQPWQIQRLTALLDFQSPNDRPLRD